MIEEVERQQQANTCIDYVASVFTNNQDRHIPIMTNRTEATKHLLNIDDSVVKRQHISTKVHLLFSRCNMLYFKSYCATMYCSSMWFDSTITSMKELKIAYNNELRRYT